MELQELDVSLEQEYDAANFLGVALEQDLKTALLQMKQNGIIKRVIEAVGMDGGMSKVKLAPL